MAMAGLTAFVLAIWWGNLTIGWLKSKRVVEDLTATDLQPRPDIQTHKGKEGTPTMGGSFLVGAFLASTLLWARLDNIHVILALALVAGFAAVGFVDDERFLFGDAAMALAEEGSCVRARVRGCSIKAVC